MKSVLAFGVELVTESLYRHLPLAAMRLVPSAISAWRRAFSETSASWLRMGPSEAA